MDPAAFCGFKANFLGAPENPRSDLPNAKTSVKNDGKPPSATSVTQGLSLWSLQETWSEQAKVIVTCFATCPFPQHENFVLLGDSKGNVALLEVNAHSGSSIIGEAVVTADGDGDSVKDVAWLRNSQGRIMAVSTEVEETLIIWRVNFEKRGLRMHERCLDVMSEESSTNKVLRCIATLPNVNGLIATAGLSGKIFIYCKNRVFPTHKIPNAHAVESTSGYGSKQSEIIGLAFKDEQTLISAGAADRKLKMWHLDKKNLQPTVLFVFTREITSIALSPSDPSRVYVSCVDNLIYCHNINSKNGSPGPTLLGHTVGAKTKIQVSPCGKYLASGSTSNFAYIWGLNPSSDSSSTPQFKLKGHKKCVNLIGWSHGEGNFKMLTASEDGSYRVWRNSDPIANFHKEGFGCLENVVQAAFSQHQAQDCSIAKSTDKLVQQPKAQNKSTTPLDGEFQDDSDSSWDSASEEEDDDIEYESECERDSDSNEEECSSCEDISELILRCSQDEYKVDSLGNECLPDHVWAKLSKL